MGMGGIISRELELVSFHTVSKGFLGECGRRGAYLEMTNIHPLVRQNSPIRCHVLPVLCEIIVNIGFFPFRYLKLSSSIHSVSLPRNSSFASWKTCTLGMQYDKLKLDLFFVQIVEELCKVASISLSPNITGQIMVSKLIYLIC